MAARRKSKKTSIPMGVWVGLGVIAGLAGGYVWRSYAPLPLPVDGPLSGRDQITVFRSGEAADANRRADAAEAELRRLSDRLAEIDRLQQDAERDLAEMQIRSILTQN